MTLKQPWIEFSHHKGMAYRPSGGGVKLIEHPQAAWALLEEGFLRFGADQLLQGIAIENNGDVAMLDAEQRIVAVIESKTALESASHRPSGSIFDLALPILRIARLQGWPIKGRVHRVKAGVYQVDVGAGLKADLVAGGAANLPEAGEALFVVRDFNVRLKRLQVSGWSPPGRAQQGAPLEPSEGGDARTSERTELLAHPLLEGLMRFGKSALAGDLGRTGEVRHASLARQALAGSLSDASSTLVAAAALVAARRSKRSDPLAAIGILLVAERELFERHEESLLSLLHLEMARGHFEAGRELDGRLYAQKAAEHALKTGKVNIAEDSLVLLEHPPLPTAA